MTIGPGLARTREAQADALASLATPLADDPNQDLQSGSVKHRLNLPSTISRSRIPVPTGTLGVGGWTVVVPAVVPACLAVPVP